MLTFVFYFLDFSEAGVRAVFKLVFLTHHRYRYRTKFLQSPGHEGCVIEIYLDTVFKTQVFIYLGNNKFFPHTFSHNLP